MSTVVHLPRAAQLFHALSDETRLGIIEMLRMGEQCVCDLQTAFAAGQSRLSYHLKVLKDAGVVVDRREGRWSYYRLEPDALAEVHDLAVSLAPGVGKRSPAAERGSAPGPEHGADASAPSTSTTPRRALPLGTATRGCCCG